MPLIDIHIVAAPHYSMPEGLTKRLADALGQALESRPQGTWVKLQILPATHYAENESDGGAEVLPVFASVLQRTQPEGEALNRQVKAVTEAIASVCQRPAERVHLVYQPQAAGRVSFGGVLVS